MNASLLIPIATIFFQSITSYAAEVLDINDDALRINSKYVSKNIIREITKELERDEQRKSQLIKGEVYTFDTRDQEGCEAYRLELNFDKEVCRYDESSPLVSYVVMRQVDEGPSTFERRVDFSKLSEKERTALESVFDLSIIGIGTFGLIYAMPESVSKWDKSMGFRGLAARYNERVKAGPVMDEDHWKFNYVAHPFAGAAYYTMVRHQGFSKSESALFSFLMSTFYWEYGIEAIAEIPSTQDIIITPLIGSLLGEVFYTWSKSISSNGGKVLGSKKLGTAANIFLNPAGAVAQAINRTAAYKLITSSELSMVTKDRPFKETDTNVIQDDPYFGMVLKLQFH